MTRGGKIALGIVGGILALLIIVGGAGAYFVYRYGREAVEAGKKHLAEGEEFGLKTDNAGCLREALARQKQDGSLTATISNKLFLSSCLLSSRPTPGFCDNVPPPGEIIKSAQWTLSKCTEAGLQGHNCNTLFQTVQKHCESPQPNQTPGENK
jgi:hypothetical protein